MCTENSSVMSTKDIKPVHVLQYQINYNSTKANPGSRVMQKTNSETCLLVRHVYFIEHVVSI